MQPVSDGRCFLLLLVLLLLGSSCQTRPAAPPRPTVSDQPPVVQSITWLVRGVGGRTDWSADGSLIAFDKVDEAGNFDVWVMQPDGTKQTCLTCRTTFTAGHWGNPAWHPSGDYLVVQALDPTVDAPLAGTRLYQLYTNPGAGFHNNLWILTRDGGQAWQITDGSQSVGVLHPHFSPSGTKLVWAAMVSTEPKLMGSWTIRLADFAVENGSPHLRNVRELTPGKLQWYEVHGFSADERQLLLTGMPFGGTEKDFDIYLYDLEQETLQPLTEPALQQWDEHAHFAPDNETIIWMSSMGIEQPIRSMHQAQAKTDYWMMARDGSNKRRITYFNEPGALEYLSRRVIAADFSFDPSGKRMVGYLQENPTLKQSGSIVILELR